MTANSEPIVTGIHAALIGVSDFTPHLDIFCDGLGWAVAAEGNLEEGICQHLWGVSFSADVKVLTSGDAPSGRIHLLKFSGAVLDTVGLPAPRTFGHHGLNMYVQDMEVMRERLLERGARFVGEARYSLKAKDGSSQTVHQIKLECADGVGVVFVNPNTPRFTHAWAADPSVFCTELTSVVVLIPNVDESRAFWGPEGMGLTFHYDGIMQNPKAAAMTGREADEQSHLLFGFGKETARVELAGRGEDNYASQPREDLTARQHPGKGLGEVGWVVCVDDMSAALRHMMRMGGNVTATPIDVNTPIHGRRTLATVETPEGICLSVWG